MPHDVFQAHHWLLDQFQIEPKALGRRVAAAPLGFHLLDSPTTLDLYEEFFAVLYMLRTGCQRRMLPREFPK